MNTSERLAKIRAELEHIEQNSNSIEGDPYLFRLNNIGYSLKRIADSLGEIKRMMANPNQGEADDKNTQ